MNGYVLDDLALVAGLSGAGSEHHRRELSRLLHDAAEGGPAVVVPALCLAQATTARPAIAGHLAEVVATTPRGAVEVCGLGRSEHLDRLRTANPWLDWPATHAAVHATITDRPILTTHTDRYTGIAVDVLTL